MKRVVAWMALLMALGLTACSYTKSYTKQRWENFKEEVRKEAAKPSSKEEACQRLEGVLYNEKCYTPNDAFPDKETCRLRGGLFLEDQCYFLEEGSPVL